ncbi:MAG: HPF/RaiA family ribosome-associated protein [Bacteroidetes bacterium]|nr:HPF/RaiA family ribosome-associated protein [Bacteroidota bacterium]
MAINVELHLDHLQISKSTHDWIEERIKQFEKGHHDITGAHLSIKQLSGKPTVNQYAATIVLYHKPENIAGISKSENINEAVQSAFSAAERQLRKARSVSKDRRKRAMGVKVLPEIENPPDTDLEY